MEVSLWTCIYIVKGYIVIVIYMIIGPSVIAAVRLHDWTCDKISLYIVSWLDSIQNVMGDSRIMIWSDLGQTKVTLDPGQSVSRSRDLRSGLRWAAPGSDVHPPRKQKVYLATDSLDNVILWRIKHNRR